MDTNTLLIILAVIFLFGGFGFGPVAEVVGIGLA